MEQHITGIHFTPDRYYEASCTCGWSSGQCDTVHEANTACELHEDNVTKQSTGDTDNDTE